MVRRQIDHVKKSAACIAILLPLSVLHSASATDVMAPVSFLGGHIEVHTDSPNSGTTAANGIYKYSQGYNVTQGDGLGRAVDGHVHDYDTLNGVIHVDLFQLEPRRGLASLAPEYQGDAPCGSGPNTLGVEVDGKCLAAVEGELNRVYDTLQTDANGQTETGMTSEVYAPGSSLPLDPNQNFIVVLANADRSNDAILQIGCRTWPVVAYQDMITSQLEASPAPAPTALKDTYHGNASLVFTLAGIQSDGAFTCPSGNESKTQGLSTSPTLRVGFAHGTQAIYLQGIHATRAACVLGLHKYNEKLCYTDRATLTAAEAAVAKLHAGTVMPKDYATGCPGSDPQATPPDDYLRDPAQNLHITPAMEGSGYRWRNGALTVQLLKVDNDTGAAAYTLQPPTNGLSGSGRIAYLPFSGTPPKRIGGTFAKAFTAIKNGGVNVVTADDTTKGANESGLLYEAVLYWHYSELADELQGVTPDNAPCYGHSNYPAALFIQEHGLGISGYQTLTTPILGLIGQYSALVCQVANAKSEPERAAALLPLAQLLDANPDLEKYHRFRDYAPGHVPEQYLLDIDKGLLNTDYDGDGLVGFCETDSDNDGLADSLETSIGTSPINPDTDGDGLTDYEEVAWDGDGTSYDPTKDLNPLSTDTDGDWLPDFTEVRTAGTDPLKADSDSDGFMDGTETAAGYDPKSPTDYPVWGDINNDRAVDAADVLLANRAVLGLVTLSPDQLARGNVAPLVNGEPDSPPDDAFTIADVLLITRKAVHNVAF